MIDKWPRKTKRKIDEDRYSDDNRWIDWRSVIMFKWNYQHLNVRLSEDIRDWCNHSQLCLTLFYFRFLGNDLLWLQAKNDGNKSISVTYVSIYRRPTYPAAYSLLAISSLWHFEFYLFTLMQHFKRIFNHLHRSRIDILIDVWSGLVFHEKDETEGQLHPPGQLQPSNAYRSSSCATNRLKIKLIN